MNSAIILAGGNGTRISSDIPKQFITIRERKLIDFSIEAFKKNKYIDEIILVFNEFFLDQFKEQYKEFTLAVGGKTRYQSALNGVLRCSEKSKNVLIHDAARPLISQKIINNCIKYLSSYEVSVPFINNIDSLIEKNKSSFKYLNRDLIKKIQTPQGFNKNIIKDALVNANSFGTDDVSTLLNYNPMIKVKFFEGCVDNFKITYDRDFKILEYIIDEN